MFTVYITSDNLIKVRYYWTTYSDECGQDYVVLIRRINLHFYNKRSSGLESKGLVVGFFFFLILIPSPSCFAHEVTNDRERDEGRIIKILVLQGLGRGREGGGRQVNFRVVRYTRIDSIGKYIFSIGKLVVCWQLLEVEMIKYTGSQ